MTDPKRIHLKATYAALYALGKIVPPDGALDAELRYGLGKHLDHETFDGLVVELERRKILALDRSSMRLARGPEYGDGLERIRLAADALKGDL